MLVNMPQTATQVILSELAALDEPFYLTGSRANHTHTEDSDWDFFAEYTPTLHEYFSAHPERWTEQKATYDDPITVRVYRSTLGRVDVQLLGAGYVPLKLVAQATIHRTIPLSIQKDKQAMRNIWRCVLETVLLAQEQPSCS